MPTVTLNKKVFENLVGKKLPLDKLKDRISYLGTDLESIEGNEIQVEIFPNRPDMLSEQGFARAFSSFIGVKKGLRKYSIKKSGQKVVVANDMKKYRPYTTCALVRNLKLNDEKIREIVQIQEKLHTTFCRNRKKAAIGIYPLENIKLPIKFEAWDPKKIKFQPLEAEKEMNAKKILSEHSKGKEYGHLIGHLKKYPVFVDANNEILSMPPIINSHKTGKITEETTDAFLEFSGFDLRYQQIGLNLFAASLIDMGATVESMEVKYQEGIITTPNLEPTSCEIDIDYVNHRLGTKLSEREIQIYLERMGYGYEQGKVLVPAYRADILHQADFVEDIAIAYGYENFKFTIPKVATIAEENPEDKFIAKITSLFVGLGLLEVKSYDISNSDSLNKKMGLNLALVSLKNALTEEYNVLRNWIVPNLLEIISRNKHNEYPQNIFELGRVYTQSHTPGKSETGVNEFNRLALVCCDNDIDFTYAKQILDYLMNALDLDCEVVEVDHPSFISGRVGRVIVAGKKIAYLGELSPSVLTNWDLDKPAIAMELNVTELFEMIEGSN